MYNIFFGLVSVHQYVNYTIAIAHRKDRKFYAAFPVGKQLTIDWDSGVSVLYAECSHFSSFAHTMQIASLRLVRGAVCLLGFQL